MRVNKSCWLAICKPTRGNRQVRRRRRRGGGREQGVGRTVPPPGMHWSWVKSATTNRSLHADRVSETNTSYSAIRLGHASAAGP